MKRDNMQKEVLDNRLRMKLNEGEGTLFSEVEKKRFSMSKEGKRCLALCIFLIVVWFFSVFFVTDITSRDCSLAVLAKDAMRRMNDLVDLFAGNELQSAIHYFVVQFISPVLAGMALAIAGVCFQSAFQNPMASPTMLGVQSGGTLGSVVFIMFFYTPMLSPMLSVGTANGYELLAAEYSAMSLVQKFGQYFFTLGGCVAVVFIVMIMAKVAGRGKISTIPLMVGGTIFSSCITKVVNLVEYYEAYIGGDQTIVQEVQSMQSGSFTAIWQPMLMFCFLITVVPPLILAVAGRNKLNVITYGEEEARALGISIRSARVYFVIVSTLLTASVVAFCGNIAFLGLIVPHFARFFVGNDFRYLVPASAFLGAVFMLLAWDISYMVNFTVNTGIVVSVAGSIAFAICMIIYRRRGNADWA